MAPEDLSNGNLGNLRVSEMAVNHLGLGTKREVEKQDV